MNLVNFGTWKLAIYKSTALAKAVLPPKIDWPIKMEVVQVQIGGRPTRVVYGMRGNVVIRLHHANFGISASYAMGHIARVCALARKMVVSRLSAGAHHGCEFIGRGNEKNSKYGRCAPIDLKAQIASLVLPQTRRPLKTACSHSHCTLRSKTQPRYPGLPTVYLLSTKTEPPRSTLGAAKK